MFVAPKGKEIIVPRSVKFKGIFVSVWFDERFCWCCKEKPKTVNDWNAPKYYIPLVFKDYMFQNEIYEYIKDMILDCYGVELAEWHKSIHVKYLYEVVDERNKIREIWVERNYDNVVGEWHSYCSEAIPIPEKENILSFGFNYYKNFGFRIIGSLFTKTLILLRSDYEYQFMLLGIK